MGKRTAFPGRRKQFIGPDMSDTKTLYAAFAAAIDAVLFTLEAEGVLPEGSRN